MVKIGIVGASGYTGYELLRLLDHHYSVDVIFATSEEYKWMPISSVYPTLNNYKTPFITHEEALGQNSVDIVFLALPHGKSAAYVEKFYKKGIRVIDLAGDSRFNNPLTYEKWYKISHPAPTYLRDVVYGLPEIFGQKIKDARIVGNPGCYPTSVIIPLYPIRDAIDQQVIVDAKSGVSGAGKSCTSKTHFISVNENFFEYSVGRSHRHVGEMEEILGKSITFSAGLLPVSRGILSTIYVRKTKPISIYEELKNFYTDAPFVSVYKEKMISLKSVVYSNNIYISVFEDGSNAIIISVIDNLIKGAAGQAIQNMNLMFGINETKGLPSGGIEL